MTMFSRTLAQRRVNHRVVALAVLVLAGLVMFTAPSAWADTVTFHDLTDSLTASPSGDRVMVGPCGLTMVTLGGMTFSAEGCTATVVGPSSSFNDFELPAVTLIGGDNGMVSDAIVITRLPSTDLAHPGFMALVTFVSDPGEVGFPISCEALGGCSITESGSAQIGATIAWQCSPDTVYFESDAGGEAVVPEPASLFLLGSGLIAMGGFVKRRLAAA